MAAAGARSPGQRGPWASGLGPPGHSPPHSPGVQRGPGAGACAAQRGVGGGGGGLARPLPAPQQRQHSVVRPVATRALHKGELSPPLTAAHGDLSPEGAPPVRGWGEAGRRGHPSLRERGSSICVEGQGHQTLTLSHSHSRCHTRTLISQPHTSLPGSLPRLCPLSFSSSVSVSVSASVPHSPSPPHPLSPRLSLPPPPLLAYAGRGRKRGRRLGACPFDDDTQFPFRAHNSAGAERGRRSAAAGDRAWGPGGCPGHSSGLCCS